MPDAFDGRPKNIVLFSDGTGNSASKPFKTNVWRTYQALDVGEPGPGERVQVARYQDGVGTETFKPLAILGGVFGFGLMGDVLRLYKFLCRNYREGDRVYGFGFSRGAFTIRVLVGLVAKCGLVQTDDESQLYHFANEALAAFRRDSLIRASENRHLIYHYLLAPPCHEADGRRIALNLPTRQDLPTRQIWPRVHFLGLWDTVDAYGMPVEELKQGIDRWIWPMSLVDRKLPTIVDRAYHALSLDDERPTFRPVLWDESSPIDAQRIEQRWFAGVHANVGGGYPIDDLAYVTLLWMLDKARGAGLRFCDDQVRLFEELKNVHGTGYDSRSGVAGYYRYGPRSVQKLCNDEKNGVHVKLRLVHHSVAERIAARRVAYSPVSLPIDLALKVPGRDAYATQDKAYVELAWDAVFWRRVTYFATVFLTLIVVISPRLPKTAPPIPPGCPGTGPCQRWTILEPVLEVADLFSGFLAWLGGLLLHLVPGWAGAWVEAYETHWIIGTALLLVLAGLFFQVSAQLQRNISERSEWAWAALKGNTNVARPHVGWADAHVRRLRLSASANKLGRFYDEVLIPNAVGFMLLVAIVSVALVTVCKTLAILCGFWLDAALSTAFVATCWSYLDNVACRNKLEAVLHPLQMPERRWTYDAGDLAAFKHAASAVPLDDGRTALQVYHDPVLLPKDLVFAVSLGLFTILAGRCLAQHVPDWRWLFHVSAGLGLLYAIFDVAEDVMLARVFGSRTVPRREAHWSPWMTRGKMVALAVSGTGLVLFLALLAVGRLRKPKWPSRF